MRPFRDRFEEARRALGRAALRSACGYDLLSPEALSPFGLVARAGVTSSEPRPPDRFTLTVVARVQDVHSREGIAEEFLVDTAGDDEDYQSSACRSALGTLLVEPPPRPTCVHEDSNGAKVWLAAEEDIHPASLPICRPALAISLNHLHARPEREAYGALLATGCEMVDAAIQDLGPRGQRDIHAERARAGVTAFIRAVEDGKSVLVHCTQAAHRSPALVAAGLYLAGRHGSITAAYAAIRDRRASVAETPTARWIVSLVRPGDPDGEYGDGRILGRRMVG